jgi:hypothetical protein
MNALSQMIARCVQVRVDQFPDVLTWKFEDGTLVQTTDLDLTERAGIHAIAGHAARLGLGEKAAIVRYLNKGRITGEGVILPMAQLPW